MEPENVTRLFEKQDIGVVTLIEMQFSSNILAFVTRSKYKSSRPSSLDYSYNQEVADLAVHVSQFQKSPDFIHEETKLQAFGETEIVP